MLRPMFISEVAIDSLTKSPIVILREIDGDRALPIWIGLFEANAIATELEGIRLSRPMTHDLLKNIMSLIGAKITSIEVCDLKDNVYYALIHIEYEGRETTIDARPSDALALSLRVDAPIFVSDDLIMRSRHISIKTEPQDKSEEGKKWQDILEKMDPEDFGNT